LISDDFIDTSIIKLIPPTRFSSSPITRTRATGVVSTPGPIMRASSSMSTSTRS